MVPPPAHPPSMQYTQQFLSSVLSQRGPAALPYSEELKWMIRQHILALIEAYPSLQPKTGTFTHNDGRTVNLLQVDGTVPMLFQGVTYNIPVIIWLMESYPQHPPLVFVNPTRDMIIKRAHPFVNPSGVVAIPYLQNWLYPSSNLVELGRNLCHYFSRDPPLYSQRRPNPNPSPSPSPNPTPSPSTSANFASIGSHLTSPAPAVRPAIPPRVFPQSPYGSGGGTGRVMDEPSEVFKRNAINKLVENLHSDIAGLRKAREAEMEGLFNAQAALRQREEQLNKGLKEMQDEKEGLEQQLQMVLMNTDLLEGWLKDNEAKLNKLGVVDVNEAFEPFDVLSKQMLDCSASDLAIEDAIYSLDKAAQDGAIPFDQYLRNVRLLSREQFFHRATASKVRAAQMQAHVSNMASKASQYAL
ncbi:protein ELC-like [Ipomoea triloba]|uniref:protein ELC-like n=1 Tax=Ipomoea triloba TaxID=35885 RepID=UPI00125DD296|nr:protein ELC-like [Ipomoea triloba]GMC90450.1 protein ELC-like [Ipomoea batatas]